MTMLQIAEARSKPHTPVANTAAGHRPVVITGKKGNAVLLAEEDWNAINETLHLLSIPGSAKSIREGMATPLDECERGLGW